MGTVQQACQLWLEDALTAQFDCGGLIVETTTATIATAAVNKMTNSAAACCAPHRALVPGLWRM